MKKFTFINIVILIICILFISMPAFAGSAQIKNNNILLGKNNTGIQGNKNHHNTIVGGNLNKGTNAGGSITNTATGGAGGNATIGNVSGGAGGQGGSATITGGNSTNTIGNNANNSNTNQQDVVFNQTIEAGETKRDHHTGTAVTFASLGTYAESKYAGANFQSATILTMFKDVFSYEAALEVYGKQFGKGLCETVGKSYNGRHLDNPSKFIKVYTMDDKIDPSTIKAIGFLTIKAVEGQDATSFTVLQKAVLSACIMRADALVVTKEGAETITKSSGWGIGFNTSGSQINDNDHGRGNSYAGSGGTGYSSGKGQLEVLPWITVQILQYK